MRLPRNRAAIVAALSFGAVLGGWTTTVLGADEETAAAAAPSPAMEQPATPAEQQPAAADQSAGTEQPASAEAPATVAEEEPQTAEGVLSTLPAAPPASLQTLVDERRDTIRKRREAMFDTFGSRYAYMPPGWATYEDGMDRYRDAMRVLYRQQRDYSRQHHNAWADAFCPWSKPRRERSELRSYLTQMDQLDRQEYREAAFYGQSWGYGAP